MILSALVAFAWLQLPFARTYFIQSVENDFSSRYHGELSIGSVEGLIPFRATIRDVSAVWVEDGYQADTLITVKKIDVSLNPLDLLSNRLSVQSLIVSEPIVTIKYDPENRFVTLNRLFQRKEAPGDQPENVVRKISVFAPFFSVENGSVNITFQDSSVKKPISIHAIELSSFLEISNELQFIDLQYLMANIDVLNEPFVQLKGQVYHDSNFLEFNGFRVWNGGNTIGLNGEISDLDVLSPDRREQFTNATYSLSVDSTRVLLSEYSNILSNLKSFDHILTLSARVNGSTQVLEVDRFDMQYGKSNVELVGEFTQLLKIDSLRYVTDLRNLVINSEEIRDFIPNWDDRLEFLNKVTTDGRVSGDFNRSMVDLRLESGLSYLEIDGEIEWGSRPRYAVELQTQDFDFSQLDERIFPSSRITSTITLDGSGVEVDDMTSNLSFSIAQSRIGEYEIQELDLTGRYNDRNLSGNLLLTDGNAQLRGELNANLLEIVDWSLNGVFERVNLKDYLLEDVISETDLDFVVNLQAIGIDPETLTGRINLDVTRAVVAGDTLGPHQFYADIFGVEEGQRELRFTSTLFDLNLLGDLNTERIESMGAHWLDYIYNKVNEEYLLDETDSLSALTTVAPRSFQDETLNLTFDLQVKDASLAQKYFPTIPNLEADLRGEGAIQATGQRILLNSYFEGSALVVGNITLRDYSLVNTMSLQYGQRLKDFSIADIVVRAKNFESSRVNMTDLRMSASINGDSARVETVIGTVGQADYGGNAIMDINLRDSSILFSIPEFNLGNQSYLWRLTEPAFVVYNQDESIQIERFQLVNNNQNVALKGTYSSELDDAMNVDVTSLDLATISDLIEGRSTFAGILNGAFETRTLFTDPVISGFFDVDHLKIDDRTIGDVSFTSEFNTQRNRFDVEMQILTDPTKYGGYLSGNNNIGQDIRLNGWINAPDNPSVADTLFYFDVDLNQIDGWIVTPIVPSVFERTEGIAKGSGFIWGTSEDFDFNARLDVQEIRAIPKFLLTNYTLSGVVELDRQDGVTFERLDIRDSGSGTGVLTGNIGFNDFQVERPFNLEMTLNQLEFLNNSFEADVPFYGRVFGSGRVSLTGSNQAPFLRTVTPITTTSSSRLSIPLLDETSVEEQARFIEFVRSFSEINNPESRQEIITPISESSNRFMETVTMDLQFIAPVNSSVQLVFDPLTGEILNAQGSGRIRITLDDQNLQMFGSFNVNSGEYVFVGGDIFVRRFQLRDGGTISWDGDPANASLNITTAYRTRPNIGILSPALGDQQTRIPVDLMLVITGTIESIENNFYFEFPNATDVSQNASTLSILNSEDQKLIQATSLLFTGGFIPVGVAGEGQTGELGASLQARAGQVGLSQLLSNQINAILNSSLSNLDIDLNLTGFDQADIGIALRLFDDRLILRGESQYSSAAETGAETTLGDLGITYRINRALSVEVFHRRDPTLRSIVGNQTQVESINGVGLEAQVQFNTWSEFRSRIWAQIRRFFGVEADTAESS
jgi:hypothetical protein